MSGTGTLDTLVEALGRCGTTVGEFFYARFEPAVTPFDWLTRDSAEINAFLRDPLCFAELSSGSLGSFIGHAETMAKPEAFKRIDDKLAILVMAGECDPLGQDGSGTALLARRLEAADVRPVSRRIYSGARHELFHELNRGEVIADLIEWLGSIIKTIE